MTVTVCLCVCVRACMLGCEDDHNFLYEFKGLLVVHLRWSVLCLLIVGKNDRG